MGDANAETIVRVALKRQIAEGSQRWRKQTLWDELMLVARAPVYRYGRDDYTETGLGLPSGNRAGSESTNPAAVACVVAECMGGQQWKIGIRPQSSRRRRAHRRGETDAARQGNPAGQADPVPRAAREAATWRAHGATHPFGERYRGWSSCCRTLLTGDEVNRAMAVIPDESCSAGDRGQPADRLNRMAIRRRPVSASRC